MTSPSHYLVVDLEATCSEDGSIPREETEIIEIGAVLVEAATLKTVREMQTFVRPIRHPRLTPFCTKLTTITQADVDAAPRFPAAMGKLRDFLGRDAALFCSWGNYDRNQLERDARRHGIRLPLGKDHWNLKAAFARRHNEGREIGVGQALRRLGLSFQGTHHRGIDDARNIARILPHVLDRAREGA
ncbi:3'-5' exonuclease [Polyangium sp. 6x1]|uniref:exonuclease domain-containing protein n=1 Tax=Polyangium sp. 6x1 TaxID=3042689 RepID=UPI0024831DD6|nr:3'-5' exonuclease [Polyangium sp. 6x1]MDI1442900.1 3'-5' exonuclease [Polyangium sp. 6x1]